MEVLTAQKKKVYSVNIVPEKEEKNSAFEAEIHEGPSDSEFFSARPLRPSRSFSNLNDSFSCLSFANSSTMKSPHTRSVSASPGPGDYNLLPLSKGHGQSFNRALKKLKSEEIQVTPGPADYFTEQSVHSYSCILIGKPKEPEFIETPGPGSYNTEQRCFSPAFSIGSSERIEKKEVTPGPSDYAIVDLYHSTNCTIGNAKRVLLGDEISRCKSPGPSDYNTDIRPHSPSAYLIGKPKEVKKLPTPGPAQYRSESMTMYSKSPAYSFPKSSRADVVRNHYPGPGNYEIKLRSTSTGCIFPKSQRKNIVKSISPGPKYNIPSTLQTKGGFIGLKHPIRQKEKSPGPGTYSSPSPQPKKFTIPKAEKFEKIRTSLVSPGSYNPKIVSNSPTVSFSSTSQKGLFRDRKSSGLRISETPGPGAYVVKNREISPVFSFAKAAREKKRVELLPGPGQYTPRTMNSSQSCRFRGEVAKNGSYATPFKETFLSNDKESPPKIRNNNYARLKCSPKKK